MARWGDKRTRERFFCQLRNQSHENNIMCIIQCINCPCCFPLMLVPLKSDYFHGGNPRHFRDWPRLDLVRRFRNAGRNYILVYDRLCMNPHCVRRNPNYRPLESERIDGKCNSGFCTERTCRLVACRGEDFCQDHFPAYEHLMRRPPVFRVRIYDDADFRDQDPFGHFMEHVGRDRRERRPFPFS
jgi:hypothetical protein